MAANTTRILIETIVRRTLREIQSAPERSIRNLVDMALNFSKGRFQKRFFESTQRMLSDEHSAYYQLVRNMVNNVDHERLLCFGMNVGYNSCTLGAKKIREIEAAEGFNIPWALFLDIASDTFGQHREAYDALLRQGKELGIFTWFIRAKDLNVDMIDLLAEHSDCAFALMCDSGMLSDELLEEIAEQKHIMLGIGLDENADVLCAELRSRKLLYAVYKEYTSGDLKDILNDNMLYDMQSLNAPITALIPDESCSVSEREIVYDYVLRKREGQKFPTILWDMVQDVLGIDTIISDDCCSAGFGADGSFFALANGQVIGKWNLFEHDLRSILSGCLKK